VTTKAVREIKQVNSVCVYVFKYSNSNFQGKKFLSEKKKTSCPKLSYGDMV